MDRDGLLEISISPDGMSATADFLPEIGAGRPITQDYVESLLETREVLYGVEWELIQETIFQVTTDKRSKHDVVIAHGKPPRPERPEYYKVIGSDHLRDDSTGTKDRVDYKSQSRLSVVQAGQMIARKIPAQEGDPGYNIRGEEIPFSIEHVPSAVPGKNTREVKDKIVATVGGQLIQSERDFHVEDRIEISGAVGYETGSIEFPGDVVLKGDVQDGFHIWSGGNIEAYVTVDVSQVFCRRDFTSKGGLVGRGGKGLLRAGGRVQARFIGNCAVQSKSSVYVKDYVYHSRVSALDRLAMGKNGKIIGGTTTAAQGLRCKQLGNKAGITTVVRAGMDFVTERRHEVTRTKLEELSVRMSKLRAQLGGNDPTDRQLDILNRIEEARMKLTEQLATLIARLDINEEALIEVDGDVFPGVVVQICRATYTVEEPMAKVRFCLEKRTGRVVPVEMTRD